MIIAEPLNIKIMFYSFFKTIWEREEAKARNWTAEQLVSWIKLRYRFKSEKAPEEVSHSINRLKSELSLRQIDECKSIPPETFEVLIEPALELLKGDQLQTCQDMFDFLSHTSTLHSSKEGVVSPATGFETFFDPIKKQILRADRKFTTAESADLRGILLLFYCYEQWDEKAFGKVSEIKIKAAKLEDDPVREISNTNDCQSVEHTLRALEFLRDLPISEIFESKKGYSHFHLYLLRLNANLNDAWKNDKTKRDRVIAVLSSLGLKRSEWEHSYSFKEILEKQRKETS